MLGTVFAIIAGAAMSIQGVFNTRLSEKIGLYESNTFVQLTAFVLSLIIMFIFGKGNFLEIANVNKLYLTGGIIGVIITVTVMLSIGNLSPTIAISIILISQLICASLIDMFGLFDSKQISFHISKLIGVALMIGGVIIFKLK